MSGIYLTVWDELDLLAAPTSGGWPHVTLGYSGGKLSPDALKADAVLAFKRHALCKVQLRRATVNTFTPHGSDTPRHDVLLLVDDFNRDIEATRNMLRCAHEPGTYAMGDPHVTYRICETRAEADAVCAGLYVGRMLPREVIITGVTID